jgi:hypothetical protein
MSAIQTLIEIGDERALLLLKQFVQKQVGDPNEF